MVAICFFILKEEGELFIMNNPPQKLNYYQFVVYY